MDAVSYTHLDVYKRQTPEPSNLPTSTSGPSEHDGSGEGSASVLLSLRGISKNFGAVQAIQNVNLDVVDGQVTALIGDNGAGKSVLIKTISGIWAPSSGHIYWKGEEIHVHTCLLYTSRCV